MMYIYIYIHIYIYIYISSMLIDTLPEYSISKAI